MSNEEIFKKYIKKLYWLTTIFSSLFIITGGLLVFYSVNPSFFNFKKETTVNTVSVEEDDYDKIENGIHVRTGLIEAEGLTAVVNNCTNCHSAKLVIQNRMNKERWNSTIRWMHDTKNLWDLGKNTDQIENDLKRKAPPVKV